MSAAGVAQADQEQAFTQEVAPLMVLHLRLATVQLDWVCDLGRPLTRAEGLWFPAQWQEREFVTEVKAKATALGGCAELLLLLDKLVEALDVLDAALVVASKGGGR